MGVLRYLLKPRGSAGAGAGDSEKLGILWAIYDEEGTVDPVALRSEPGLLRSRFGTAWRGKKYSALGASDCCLLGEGELCDAGHVTLPSQAHTQF